jgi:hypothetical protein
LTGNASEMQPLQGLIEMDPEQPIPAFILVDLPVLQTLTIQFPEPLLCPPSPPIDSELPEVLHYDPTEDILLRHHCRNSVFMV